MSKEYTMPDFVIKVIIGFAVSAAVITGMHSCRDHERIKNLETQVKLCRQLSVEEIDANKDGRLDIQVTNSLVEKQVFFNVDGKYMTIDQITEKYGTEGAKKYKIK
ncbi:hypothetical protein KY346_05225 [Candidatus Woesearchaeota archaeon]|nr:hypothetical protein [Candidatus Woesearchaeota archaeon]